MTGRAAMRLLIAVALIALVLSVLDSREAMLRLKSVDPGWVFAGICALTLQTGLSAWRWRLTASQLGVRIDTTGAVREYYQAQFLNQILPGGVLGDVGRAIRSAGSAGLMRASQAVVLERMLGNAMLILVMLAAVCAAWIVPDWHGLPTGVLWLIALILTVVLVGAALFLLPWRRGRLALISAATREAVALAVLSPQVLRKQVLLSLGTVLANLGAFACAALATGVDLPALTALILIPPILFTMLIPITVSGWGLREGAAAALFPVAGFSAEAGLAASVAFGLMFLASSLPGLVIMLWDAAGNARRGQRVLSQDTNQKPQITDGDFPNAS